MLIPVATRAEEDAASAYRATVDQAIAFLRSTGQAADGSYSAYAGPGVTAVVTTGLLQNGISPRDPLVAKSLQYLAGFAQPDGGIYQPSTLYGNYETCLAIMCFTAANREGRYDELLANAEKYLRKSQWDESEGHAVTSNNYGGAG